MLIRPIPILAGHHTEHLFELRGEIARGGEAYTGGNVIDGKLGCGKQLGRAFQSHIADEVGA